MKQFSFKNFKKPTVRRFGTYLILGVIVVLIGTYFAYQFGEVFSPSSLLRSGDPRVEFKTSDRSNTTTPLQNDVNATDKPSYDQNPEILLLRITGNNIVDLPRIQGEIWYQ